MPVNIYSKFAIVLSETVLDERVNKRHNGFAMKIVWNSSNSLEDMKNVHETNKIAYTQQIQRPAPTYQKQIQKGNLLDRNIQKQSNTCTTGIHWIM
jgi:hypothetical protein